MKKKESIFSKEYISIKMQAPDIKPKYIWITIIMALLGGLATMAAIIYGIFRMIEYLLK